MRFMRKPKILWVTSLRDLFILTSFDSPKLTDVNLPPNRVRQLLIMGILSLMVYAVEPPTKVRPKRLTYIQFSKVDKIPLVIGCDLKATRTLPRFF